MVQFIYFFHTLLDLKTDSNKGQGKNRRAASGNVLVFQHPSFLETLHKDQNYNINSTCSVKERSL